MPTSGCPASGSSTAGVKMRRRALVAVVHEHRLAEAEIGGDRLLGPREGAGGEEDPERVAAAAVGRDEHADDVESGGRHGASVRRSLPRRGERRAHSRPPARGLASRPGRSSCSMAAAPVSTTSSRCSTCSTPSGSCWGSHPADRSSLPPGGAHWYAVARIGFPDHDTFHATFATASKWLDAVLAEEGIPMARTVIGGFSQGAVMSYALGLGAGRPRPAGIVALSGFIPTVDGFELDLDSRAGMPVAIGHGVVRPGDRRRVGQGRARPAQRREPERHIPRIPAAARRRARVPRGTGSRLDARLVVDVLVVVVLVFEVVVVLVTALAAPAVLVAL